MNDKVTVHTPDLFKSNEYIKILQLKKQMTLNQQKIFDAVLSTVQQMNQRGEVEEIIREGDLELDYDLFYAHLIKGSRIKKINRKDLEQAMLDLVSISFSWSNDTEVGAFVLFQKGVIDFNTRKVKITFGKDFRTENMLPSANYTALSYEYLNKFKSQYSRLLYQYFKMLIGKDMSKPFRTDIKLELNFLHKLFGITASTHKDYISNTGSFIKRCIKPAQNEINLHTDITVEYNTIKKGRFIHTIEFIFKPKENYVAALKFDSAEIKNMDITKNIATFRDFKKYVVDKFSGKEIANNVPGYLPETVIKMNEIGFLINKKIDKPLSNAESLKVWEYLFKNQSKVGVIHIISDLLKAKNYISRHISTLVTNIMGGKEEVILVITDIIEEEPNLFRLVMRNKLDFHNEKPIRTTELYDLNRIEGLNYVD